MTDAKKYLLMGLVISLVAGLTPDLLTARQMLSEMPGTGETIAVMYAILAIVVIVVLLEIM